MHSHRGQLRNAMIIGYHAIEHAHIRLTTPLVTPLAKKQGTVEMGSKCCQLFHLLSLAAGLWFAASSNGRKNNEAWNSGVLAEHNGRTVDAMLDWQRRTDSCASEECEVYIYIYIYIYIYNYVNTWSWWYIHDVYAYLGYAFRCTHVCLHAAIILVNRSAGLIKPAYLTYWEQVPKISLINYSWSSHFHWKCSIDPIWRDNRTCY